MQAVNCSEPVECNTVWAAPEVVCGACYLSSDTWSIGTITYRLCLELIIQKLKQELRSGKKLAGGRREELENFVDSKKALFTRNMYKGEQYVPNHAMPCRDANNAVAISQMVAVAKDAVVDKKSKRCRIVQENYYPTFAKELKVKQVESFSACVGRLPWDTQNRGYPKNDCLELLCRHGLSGELADFIQSCWVFDGNKRPKAAQMLCHRVFGGASGSASSEAETSTE